MIYRVVTERRMQDTSTNRDKPFYVNGSEVRKYYLFGVLIKMVETHIIYPL